MRRSGGFFSCLRAWPPPRLARLVTARFNLGAAEQDAGGGGPGGIRAAGARRGAAGDARRRGDGERGPRPAVVQQRVARPPVPPARVAQEVDGGVARRPATGVAAAAPAPAPGAVVPARPQAED